MGSVCVHACMCVHVCVCQVSSQHPYAEEFIGKPYVWTVDMTNTTDVQETVRAILRTEVSYHDLDSTVMNVK